VWLSVWLAGRLAVCQAVCLSGWLFVYLRSAYASKGHKRRYVPRSLCGTHLLACVSL
jgi:hypothetical protein